MKCNVLVSNILTEMIDTLSLRVKTKHEVITVGTHQCGYVIFNGKCCWFISGEKEMFGETFRGLIAATGGDPGGLCVAISRLNVWFAICMHSSSVFRKVAHVDFTMFPLSMAVWGGPTTYQHAISPSPTVVPPTIEASLISPSHSNLMLTSAVSTSSSFSLILFTCCRRRSQ